MDSKSALAAFALETGGQSFLNGVGPDEIARRIAEDLWCIYVASVDPGDLPRDRRLKLKVKTTLPGLTIRSRSGVMILSDEERLRSGTRCLALHIHHTADGEQHESVTVHPLYDSQGQIRFFLEVLAREQVATVKSHGEGKMVGRSPAFVGMLELVSRVADASTTVVLLGESGTGKDLVARGA